MLALIKLVRRTQAVPGSAGYRSSSRALAEGSRCVTFKLSWRDPSTSLGMTVIFFMVKVFVNYTGNLHFDATHGPSQSQTATDASPDKQDKGETFAPPPLG